MVIFEDMIDIKSTHKSPSSGGRLVILKSDEDAMKYKKNRQAKKNKKKISSNTAENKPKILPPIVNNNTENKQERKVPKENYAEQLKEPKWAAFRKFIFAVRGQRCEHCGSPFSLQIHHMLYKSGAMAWEYTCNDVLVLCEKCHKQVHGIIA